MSISNGRGTSDYGSSHDAWIISPEIEVGPAKDNPRFGIRYWYELAAGDTAYIYVRADGGNWTELMRLNQSGHGSWRNVVLPLRDYEDRTVEFGFRLVTNTAGFAPGLFLDDARVITGGVGMDPLENFENGWGDWSAYGGVWDVGAPTTDEGPAPVDGKGVVGTGLSADYADSHDAWLVSPILDVPKATKNRGFRSTTGTSCRRETSLSTCERTEATGKS